MGLIGWAKSRVMGKALLAFSKRWLGREPSEAEKRVAKRRVKALKTTLKEAGVEKLKKGWRSSEFWTMALTGIIMVFNKQLGLNLPEETISSIINLALLYIGGRSVVKGAQVLGSNGK